MIVVDTSVLVRFFTNDDSVKAEKVKNLLDSAEQIFLPDVVFPELEYVLADAYGVKRQELEDAFQFLINRPNIKVNLKVKTALDIFKQSKLDFADSLIAAEAMGKKLASFDKELLETTDVGVYWD